MTVYYEFYRILFFVVQKIYRIYSSSLLAIYFYSLFFFHTASAALSTMFNLLKRMNARTIIHLICISCIKFNFIYCICESENRLLMLSNLFYRYFLLSLSAYTKQSLEFKTVELSIGIS